MKIGIDARVMYPEASGIGRYSMEIVKAIAAMPESIEHEFILYPGISTEKVDLPSNWRYSKKKITSRGILRALMYPLIVRGDNLDLFYSMDYLGPLFSMPCKTIITIYDLIPIINPDYTSIIHRLVAKYFLPLSIRNIPIIVSISDATKKDILKYLDAPEDIIRIIYLGKNSSFNSNPNEYNHDVFKKALTNYELDGRRYILFVGSLEPRKNLYNMLKAFSLIEYSERKNFALILVGNINPNELSLKIFIKKFNLEGQIIITGFIEEEHLPVLLREARGFCFPSFYEGFGLPVLEAMACGCPVITSNVSSLPEVVGDAAILIDPHDVQQISDAMKSLFLDDELCMNLKAKGLEQANKFSWEKAASELLEIFNAI